METCYSIAGLLVARNHRTRRHACIDFPYTIYGYINERHYRVTNRI